MAELEMLEKFLKNGKKNMEYSIKLAGQFLDEFEEICEYISKELKNINASNRLREKVIYNVLLLENYPKTYTEIEKTLITQIKILIKIVQLKIIH